MAELSNREKGNAMRRWRSEARKANRALDTARAFLMDGALLTAARYYREAATHLENAQHARNKAMGMT